MDTERVNTGAGEYRPSRKIALGARCALGVLEMLAACVLARAAGAQSSAADSLAERLRRAEAAIATLQQQISDVAESGVRARSRAHMELSGRVAVNGFGNSRRVNNVDNPQFVRPDTTPGVPVRGVGMAIRQTRLGLAVTVADVLGGAFSGDLDVDFYGGQQPSSGGRTFPLVRLRTARGVVRWSNAELMIGQESPLLSGINPVTSAAIGTPDFAASGRTADGSASACRAPCWLPPAATPSRASTPTMISLNDRSVPSLKRAYTHRGAKVVPCRK